MYIVINRTKGTEIKYKGSFPYSLVVDLLENGDDLIVISTYSNTIKVPYLEEDGNNYGETKSHKDWAFKDYDFSTNIFL
jgi:hypothetical protein